MIKIAPSLLSANGADFGAEVKKLETAHADLIHFDVMDGHFVPNITYGPKILKDVKKYTNLPFDTHLMVKNPKIFIPWFAEAGADILTFHLEADSHPEQTINLIKSFGIKAGISIRPNTEISKLKPYIHMADLIHIMSVEPGFGGQTFLESSPQRIIETKKLIGFSKTLIEVDGGITPLTAKLCIEAGADILVAGTSVFKDKNYKENITALRNGGQL